MDTRNGRESVYTCTCVYVHVHVYTVNVYMCVHCLKIYTFFYLQCRFVVLPMMLNFFVIEKSESSLQVMAQT